MIIILLFSCHAAPSIALLLVVSGPIRSSSWGSCLHSSLCNSPALQRLNLTADEITVIETRLNGITPRQRHDRHIDDGEDHENLVVSFAGRSQTIERNLAYIEDRLELNVEELRRIVVDYPRILSLSLENDLIHTIDFFDDALSQTINDSNVRSLLCYMPRLLEYNVAKRLKPRLQRVRLSLLGRDACVDTEMLRLIATLTDSRFEFWLQSLHSHQDEEDTNGDSNVDDEQYQPTYKQSNTPALYVIVSNLQSGNNIGNILKSASIFGCEEFIVVGQRRHRLTGEHGSRFDLQRRHLWSHIEAKEYLHAKGVRIYGIEIMENAIPVMDMTLKRVSFTFHLIENIREQPLYLVMRAAVCRQSRKTFATNSSTSHSIEVGQKIL